VKQRARNMMIPLRRAAASGERWGTVYSSVVLAIVVGLGAAMLLLVTIIGLARPMRSVATDPAQIEANGLALAQVLIGLAAFGLARGTLVFVVVELARNRAAPSLRLSLTDTDSGSEVGALTLEHDGHVDLVLHNHGNLAVQWFMVEIEVPFLSNTARAAEPGISWCLEDDAPASGLSPAERALLAHIAPLSGRGSWHATWHAETTTAMLRFERDGALAAYPGAATVLGRLHVPVDGAGARKE